MDSGGWLAQVKPLAPTPLAPVPSASGYLGGQHLANLVPGDAERQQGAQQGIHPCPG